MKAETGNRKEARKMRQQGRQLLKTGKHLAEQGRLLRKGKISLYAVRDCERTNAYLYEREVLLKK